MARFLVEQKERLFAANALDVAAARASGMGSAKVDRLTLTEARLLEMAKGIEEVAALPDPIGQIFDETTVASGMHVEKMRVPLGVILYDLRVAPKRDGRGGVDLPEGVQRGDPARRLRGEGVERSDRACAVAKRS